MWWSSMNQNVFSCKKTLLQYLWQEIKYHILKCGSQVEVKNIFL